MADINQILKTLREHERTLKVKFKVKRIGIFGSYTRKENRAGSDLDVLVEFEPEHRSGLLSFINFENYLSNLLGIKVDLVEKPALKPRIGKQILKEVVYT